MVLTGFKIKRKVLRSTVPHGFGCFVPLTYQRSKAFSALDPCGKEHGQSVSHVNVHRPDYESLFIGLVLMSEKFKV